MNMREEATNLTATVGQFLSATPRPTTLVTQPTPSRLTFHSWSSRFEGGRGGGELASGLTRKSLLPTTLPGLNLSLPCRCKLTSEF